MTGNSRLINWAKDGITHGVANTLITGPKGTGKTRLVNLAMKAAMCQHRGNAYDPCNQCVSCQSIGEAREDHWGLVGACSGSGGNYFRVDVGRAKASNLDDLLKNALFEEVTTLIVLDEALGLVEQGLERRLLKSIDESPCIWIVVAIKAMAAMKKGRVQGLPGLLPESRLDLAEKIVKPKTLADIAVELTSATSGPVTGRF